MRYITDPEEATRVLGLRPIERAGVYVRRDAAGVQDSRHFKLGDRAPAAYVYSHPRGAKPATPAKEAK